MLLSMTGYGEARSQSEQLSFSVELRALNNRYLKVSLRAPDPYHLLEAEFEKLIRKSIKRGTIQVHLRCERQATAQDFRIDPVALTSYVQQIRDVSHKLLLPDQGQMLLGQALMLPGVVPEAGSRTYQLHEDWPLIEKALQQALAHLLQTQSRHAEKFRDDGNIKPADKAFAYIESGVVKLPAHSRVCEEIDMPGFDDRFAVDRADQLDDSRQKRNFGGQLQKAVALRRR